MTWDSTLVAAFIGASVLVVGGAITFFVAWGSLHAKHDALKEHHDALKDRVVVVESQMAALADIRSDVSYIRGVLDGEGRSRRKRAVASAE